MGAREWRVICIEGGGEGERRGRGSARWRSHEGRPWAAPSGIPLCLPSRSVPAEIPPSPQESRYSPFSCPQPLPGASRMLPAACAQ